MSNAESIESSDRQTAGSKASRPAGLSLFDRGRRAYYVGLNRTIKTWDEWWHAILAFAALCVMAVTLIYWAPALQLEIGEIEAGRLAAIQTLLVTIGGSFIGATAIVSAMLMYALQVNVERMPHKLFRRPQHRPKNFAGICWDFLAGCLGLSFVNGGYTPGFRISALHGILGLQLDSCPVWICI